jgi:hypothetical protein
MTPTIVLQGGRTVEQLGQRVTRALDELMWLEPTKYALGHWLTGAYRATLVGSQSPTFTLRTTADVAGTILQAQAAIIAARAAAALPGDGFVSSLPPRVHVVRVRDLAGVSGFAPLDVPGATLEARGLSVLLADYLMFPEHYVAAPVVHHGLVAS